MAEAEAARVETIARMQREQIDRILEEEGWNLSQAFEQSVYDRYREHNQGKTIWKQPWMSDEDRSRFQAQVEPLVIPPEEIAEHDQRLAQINQRMREVDPNFSVFKNGKTKRLASWLMRQAGPDTPHYFIRGGEAGGQPSLMMTIGQGFNEATSAVMDMGLMALDRMSGGTGEAWWRRPSNWLVDPHTGEMVHDGGRISFAHVLHNTKFWKTKEQVQREVFKMQRGQEWYEAQKNGFDKLITGAAYVLPSVYMIGGALGGAMKFGMGVSKGLVWLGSGGQIATMAPKAQKIISVLAGTSGAMAGSGAFEMVAFGSPQGAAKAFWHGAMMAPAYLAVGWLGGTAARKLKQKYMPRAMADFIGGAVEGALFTPIEVAQMGLLWNFLRDPTRESWRSFEEAFGVNMLAFGLLKMMRGRPFEQAAEELGLPMPRPEPRPVPEAEAALPPREPFKPQDPGEMRTEAAAQEARYAEWEKAGVPRQEIKEYLDLVRRRKAAEGVRPGEAIVLKRQEVEMEARMKRAAKGRGVSEEQRRARKARLIGMRARGVYEIPIETTLREGREKSLGELVRKLAEEIPDTERDKLQRQLETLRRRMAEGEAQIERRKVEAEETLLPEKVTRPTILDTALTRRLAKEGISLVQRPDGRFEVIRPEGVTKPEMARRLDRAQVQILRRKGGGFDVIDTTEPLQVISPEEPGGDPSFVLKRPLGVPEERRVEQVGLPEGQPERRLIEDIDERKGSPLSQMIQEGGKEGLEAAPTPTKKSPPAPAQEVRRRLAPEQITIIERPDGGWDVVPMAGLSEAKVAAALRRAGFAGIRRADGSLDLVDLGREVSPEERLPPADQPAKAKPNEVTEADLEAARQRTFDVRAQFEAAKRAAEIEDPEKLGETRVPPPHRVGGPTAARYAAPASGGEAALEGLPGVTPVRASDVALELYGFKGDPTRFVGRPGGFSKAGVRGYIDTRADVALLENIFDIANLAHEWGHNLQRKTVGLDWEPHPGIRAELLDIGRPMWEGSRKSLRRKYQEGWAEYFARRLLGDKELSRMWPTLHDSMNQWISEQSPKIQQAIDRRMAVLQAYRDQGAVDRAVMLTHWEWHPESEQAIAARGPKLQNWLARQVTNWFDNIAGWNRSIKEAAEITGLDPTSIPAHLNPYRVASALRMTAHPEAETWLWTHTLGTDKRVVGDSLFEALRTIEGRRDAELAFAFAISRRTLERQDRMLDAIDDPVERRNLELDIFDQESPITLQTRRDALDVIARLQSPKYDRIADMLRAYSNHLVDYLAESGKWSIEEAEIIKETDLFYVPMQRAFIGKVLERKPGYIGGVDPRPAFFRFKGSSREFKDHIRALIDMTVATIRAGHMHQVIKAAYTLQLKMPGLGPVITEVQRPTKVQSFSLERIGDALSRVQLKDGAGDQQHELEWIATQLKELGEGNADAMMTLFTKSMEPNPKEPIIPWRVRYSPGEIEDIRVSDPDLAAKMEAVNGRDTMLHLDVDAYEAIKGLSATPNVLAWLGPIGWFMRRTTQAVKLGATGLNVDFMVRNIFRDGLQQPILTKDPDTWLPFSRSLKGIMLGLGKGDLLELEGSRIFMEGGAGKVSTLWGGMRTSEEMLTGLRAKKFRDELAGPFTLYQRSIDWITNTFAAPETWGRKGEAGAIYRKAVERGAATYEAVIEAMEAGKEIGVDFSRHGVFARSISQVIPYFNPSLQGGRKIYMRLSGGEGPEMQKMTWARAFMHLGSLTALEWLLNQATQESRDEWDDRPTWHRNSYWSFPAFLFGRRVSLPKPFELGKAVANPIEWILDTVAGRNPVAATEIAWDMMKGLVAGYPYAGAWIIPFLEVSAGDTGVVYWQGGRPIVPHYMADSLMPQFQFNRNTSRWARMLGTAFGVSPMKVDHFLNAHSGGINHQVSRVVNELFGVRPVGTDGDSDWLAAIPGLSTLIRQTPHRSGFYAKEVYRIDELLRRKAGSPPGVISPVEESFRSDFRWAASQLSAIDRALNEGLLRRQDADYMRFELSKPLIDLFNEELNR